MLGGGLMKPSRKSFWLVFLIPLMISLIGIWVVKLPPLWIEVEATVVAICLTLLGWQLDENERRGVVIQKLTPPPGVRILGNIPIPFSRIGGTFVFFAMVVFAPIIHYLEEHHEELGLFTSGQLWVVRIAHLVAFFALWIAIALRWPTKAEGG